MAMEYIYIYMYIYLYIGQGQRTRGGGGASAKKLKRVIVALAVVSNCIHLPTVAFLHHNTRSVLISITLNLALRE